MPDALIEKVFAGYRVESLIGRGGMGVVHAAGEHDGVLFIAMRFVPGDDLRTILRLGGRMAPEQATHVIAQVASALDAAHAHGLVHRDVKPANVLLTPEGHVYLTDFGLSKRLSSQTQATRSGVILGTLDYMAPEQIRGETIGTYTDVYSLGCLIAHLLTGEVPFPVRTDEGKLWAHFTEPPPRVSERVPSLGTRFDPVIARAMNKHPDRRYQHAGEVGDAMTAAAATTRGVPGACRCPPAACARARSSARPPSRSTSSSSERCSWSGRFSEPWR